MGFEILLGIISGTIGLLTIGQRVGSIYYEIQESRHEIQSLGETLGEVKKNVESTGARLKGIETYLIKNTDYQPKD